MLGHVFSLIGASITFVKENDLKTITKTVAGRDVHPLLQFIKYGVCGVVAFTTHQVVALVLGQTVFRDGEFDLTLHDAPTEIQSGGHEVILTRNGGNNIGIALSHRTGLVTVPPDSAESARVRQLQARLEPLWSQREPIPFRERVAILDAVEEITGFNRKSVREQHSVINNTLAFLCSGVVAYVLNVLFVFTPGRHSKWMEITLFVLVSMVSYVGGITAVKMVFKTFGEGPLLSVIANLGFAFTSAMVNFVCRKFIIFSK